MRLKKGGLVRKLNRIMCKSSLLFPRWLVVSSFVSTILPLLLAGCSDPIRAPHGLAVTHGPIQGPSSIVCWGDSMTVGNEGITDLGAYPAILEAKIGPQVLNGGVGGQTSTQIGVRQGGVPTYATVLGGSIPAHGDGGVTVLFKTGYEPLTSPNGSVRGSILGVEGNITLSGFLPGGTFTFTPISGSAPVNAPGTPQFVPDTPYKNFLPVFWEGRNNLIQTTAGPWGPTQILSDIAAQVASVPRGVNYLVLSVLNENTPPERKGGTIYSTLIGLNNSLSTTYGAHYLDVRSILVNSYNPSLPTDVSDYENDMPPTSLGDITAQGTLSGAIGATQTSFSVNLTAGSLRVYQKLIIDNESIFIVSVSGSTVTSSIRGYGGIVSSHSAGAQFTAHDGAHLNKQGYTIVANAVAAKLAAP